MTTVLAGWRDASGERREAGRRVRRAAGRAGLARGTVRKAIDALADEGLVVRVQGRGTYVA